MSEKCVMRPFTMGEGLRNIMVYKASKGMLAEFGKKRDTPYCRAWIYWNCSRFSDERL
jgi:hypothetical protein